MKDVGENCYLRTARKRWHCHGMAMGARSPECTTTIEPRTRYIECVDSSPIYQSGDRYCIPCARVQLGTMVDWSLVDKEV